MKVSSKDFQRNTGFYQDLALKEEVTITHYGRSRLVLMDAEEHKQLRKRARLVMSTNELSSEDLNTIASSVMSEKHNHLNSELND